MPLSNVMRSDAGGAAAIGGTLAAVIGGATHGYSGPQRGVVCTTCDGGSGVPCVRCAYIASIARTKYTCSGTKRCS